MLEGMRKTCPLMSVRAQARRHVVGGLPDVALAPQIIVERVFHISLIKAKEDVDARRLDVGVNHAHTPPFNR
jgi:hypothetical protein